MSVPVAYHSPQATSPKAAPSGWGKLWAAFGLGVLAFFIYLITQIVASLFVEAGRTDVNTAVTICDIATGLLIVLFILALGGKNILKPSMKGMGTAWKAAAWLFVVDAILVVFDIVMEYIVPGEQIAIADDWPVRMLLLVVMCLGIGLFEESLVRGLCLNGLLSRMGRSTGGVIGAAVLSSLVFGMLHFDFFVDLSDPLLMAQNVMKVVQTAIVGYVLAAILVKTRNIWTVAILHAADDFLLMFLYYGLQNEELSTEYVVTGSEGVESLIAYIVVSILYIPLVVIGTRMLKEVGAWRGDFYHYDTAAASAPAYLGAPVQPGMPGIPVAQAVPTIQTMPTMQVAPTTKAAPTTQAASRPLEGQPAAQPATTGPKHAKPGYIDYERDNNAQNL